MDNFGKRRGAKYDKSSLCKDCVASDNKKRHDAKNAWRAANRERTRETNRKSVARNIEGVRKHKLEWSKRNAGYVNSVTARRRALKKCATPKWIDPLNVRAFYLEAAALSKITGEIWTVDHIVPLQSKIVCGLHCEFNLTVVRKVENSRKGNRYWPDMP